MEGVPGRLTVELPRESGLPCEYADERQKRCEKPQENPAAQFFLRHLFCPRREKRHEKVDADEHPDEPEVAVVGREVEEELPPIAALHRHVDTCPDAERNEDARETAFQEIACGVADREEEKRGGDDEERDGCAHRAIDDRHPCGVEFRGDGSSFCVEVERFAGVNQEDHEDGNCAQPVEEDNPVSVGVHRSFLSCTQFTKFPSPCPSTAVR